MRENKCPNCGKDITGREKFCHACGFSVASRGREGGFFRVGRFLADQILEKDELVSTYRGMTEDSDDFIVIKEIHSDNFLDPVWGKEAAKSFLRMTRTAVRLDFPGIPKTHDIGEWEGAYYWVESYIPGQSLQVVMAERNRTPLPCAQVTRWLKQALDILEYLHSIYPPFVCANMKPSKVLVGEKERIYIIPYSIPLSLRREKGAVLTGTPGYAAPEEYKGNSTARSNIYSLGAIIHYLLTGRDPADPSLPPFVFERPGKLNSGVNRELEDLVMRMLEMNQEKRPASVGEIRDVLDGMEKRVGPGTASGTGLFNKAIARYNRGEFKEALKYFTRALLVEPDNKKMNLWRGMTRKKLGDPEGAIRDFDLALGVDPLYTPALQNRGEVYGEMGDFDKAVKDFNLAVNIDPGYSQAYMSRGLAFRDQGMLEDAIKDFSQAARIDPRFDEAYLWRGLCEMDRGNFKRAVEDFDRAIEINPDYVEALAARGTARDGLGDYCGSLEDNGRALEIDPDFAPAYYGRAVAFRGLGNTAFAMEDLDRAIQLDPDDPEAFNERGQIRMQLARDGEALKDFNRAIELDPEFIQAYYNRALLNRRMGRIKEAEEDFKKYGGGHGD